MKDLIELQNCNMHQLTSNAGKSDWQIRENITDNILDVLPNTISDRDIFAIVKFARKFELKAFNVGIDFGKKKGTAPLHDEIRYLKEQLAASIEHSDKLANKLEELLINDEV